MRKSRTFLKITVSLSIFALGACAHPGKHTGEIPAGVRAGGEVHHIVKKDETLAKISEQYKVPLGTIRAANNITDVNRIEVGQRVVIPGTGESGGRQAAPTEKKESILKKAKVDITSETYLYIYERDISLGTDKQLAPLYEYISGDIYEFWGEPYSFHFYGWGRLDLGDETGSDRTAGDLSSFYLQYLSPEANTQYRIGRFFLAEGTAAETIDGVFAKSQLRKGIGASAFAGVPVEHSSSAIDEGDSILGARVFYVREGVVEFGLTYLLENGDFRGDDRKEMGGDLWFRPHGPFELTARTIYNLSTSELALGRYVVRFIPNENIDLSVGTEGYGYNDYFQSALNPAFGSTTLDFTDEVQSRFALLNWKASDSLTVEAGLQTFDHDAADPGDADRAEVGIRYLMDGFLDMFGASLATQSADLAENEYTEYRAFGKRKTGDWDFALDALTQRYTQAISGEKNSIQVVGSAGFRLKPNFKVSGDLRYTKSPTFKKDFAVLLRATLDLDNVTGVKR